MQCLDGWAGAGSLSYSFKITGLPSGSYDWYIGNTKQSTKIANNGTISIKAGQTATIKEIAADSTITATETAPSAVTGGSWSYSPTNRTLSAKVVSGSDTDMGTLTNTFTPNDQTVTFKNVKPGNAVFSKTASNENGTVTVSKTVRQGPTSDYSKEFRYTLTLNPTNATVSYKKYNGNTQVGSGAGSGSGTSIANNGTFTLHSGQKVVLIMPAGTTYTITEDTYRSDAGQDMYTTKINNVATTTRQVSGTVPSVDLSTQTFTYTVTGLDRGNISYNIYNNTNASGTAASTNTISNNGTVTLKHGQSIKFLNVKSGNTVQLVESTVATTGGKWSYTPANRTRTAAITAGGTTAADGFVNKFTPDDIPYAYDNFRNPTWVKLQKKSTNNTCTAQLVGNNMYSQTFTDAVFTLNYKDVNTGAVTTSTISPDVNATSPTFTATKTFTNFWVGDSAQMIETKAPKGYLLPSQRDVNPRESNTIGYNVLEQLESGNKIPAKNTFTFSDEPTFDPGGLVIRKGIYDNSGTLTVSNANKPVSGVVFKFEYFDTATAPRTGGTPTRTWYFVTDEDGELYYYSDYIADTAGNWLNRDKDGTIYSDTVNRTLWQSSSAYHASDTIRAGQYLYKNNDNDEDLPLGSIRVTEVFAPAGYVINDTVLTGTISQDANNNNRAKFAWDSNSDDSVNVPASPSSPKNAQFGNPQKYGSIEIHKEDVEMVKAQGDANFKNIQVTIYNKSGYEIILGDDAGTKVANGAAICTLTFGTDGVTEDVVSTYKYFGNKDVIPIGASLGVRNATSMSDTAVDWPYEVRETKTNQMYHLNSDWKMSVRMYDSNPANKDVKLTPCL